MESEFEAAILPYLKELHAYCYRLTSSKWDAEDLCQDVLLRVFQYYRKIGMFEQPRPLLYKAARNLWIDHHRKKMKGSHVPMEEAADLMQTDTNYAAARGLVEWIAEHLSRREIAMLFLAEVFRYSYQEIAEELNCSVPAVKMVLHRSKLTLRAVVNPGRVPAIRQRRRDATAKPAADVDYWTHALMNHEPGQRAVLL